MQKIATGLGAGFGFLALVLLFFWMQGGLAATAPSKARPYTHMHCPDCALELTYSPTQENRPCPQCGPKGPRLLPTVGPYKGSEAESPVGPAGKFIVAVLLALPLYGGLMYLVIMRRRSRQAEADAARLRKVICHCPFCQRKLGFPAALIGTGVVCRRCKTAFTLAADACLDPGS